MSETTNQNGTNAEFGKWRSLLWPIHAFEMKKLLPMLLMMFCVLFNYTVLRDAKDALIVTASGSGAETIPFLKVWGVVPCALIFMVIFAKLSNILSKPMLFYCTISFFILFFLSFAIFIYPNRELLHPHQFADMLQSSLPAGFKGLVAVIRNWTFSAFYIMAELWGSCALSLMFWGFANDITRVSEAKRFYPLFPLGGNIALLVSGPTIIYFANLRNRLPSNVDAWGVTLLYLMSLVAIMGVIVMLTYSWINRNVMTDPRLYDPKEVKKKKKKKKMSLKESFLYLTRSKYLGCIALLVIGYGISINLVEVTWKSQLKLQYPNPNDYLKFMGMFSAITGVVSIIMMLFIGGNVMRIFGWGTAAMITPVILILTGFAFFSVILFKTSFTGAIAMMGTSPLMLAIVIGMIQNIATKSTKYALFDPTKEMAYIPLDDESKVKGKAAIDVVGARLGKSGGALIQQVLLISLGSVALLPPYVAIILFAVIGGWIVAVKSLNRQFIALTSKKTTEDEEEKELQTAEATN